MAEEELKAVVRDAQCRLAARKAAQRAEFRDRSDEGLQVELQSLRDLTESFAPAEVSARAAAAWGQIGRINRELHRRRRGADHG